MINIPRYSAKLLIQKKQAVAKRTNELMKSTEIYCRQLESQLDDLLRFMQSMQVIAVNARIEAGNLSSNKLEIDNLSLKIDENTAVILLNVQLCKARIMEIFQA